MTILSSASKDEIACKLQKLTDASALADYGDHPALRDLGYSAYMLTYDWLVSHGVKFEYDRVQGYYVEVDNGD